MPMIDARGITLIGLTLATSRTAWRATRAAGRPPTALDSVLDAVRDRYGTDSVTRAVLLGRDPGLAIPLLPD